MFLCKCFYFFKLLFSLLLFTTQVVLELEHSSDVIPFLRELVCLVYFLSSSAGRRANCQLDWHFLDLEKLNLQVRNYWFFIGIIRNRSDICFVEQKNPYVNGNLGIGFQWIYIWCKGNWKSGIAEMTAEILCGYGKAFLY